MAVGGDYDFVINNSDLTQGVYRDALRRAENEEVVGSIDLFFGTLASTPSTTDEFVITDDQARAFKNILRRCDNKGGKNITWAHASCLWKNIRGPVIKGKPRGLWHKSIIPSEKFVKALKKIRVPHFRAAFMRRLAFYPAEIAERIALLLTDYGDQSAELLELIDHYGFKGGISKTQNDNLADKVAKMLRKGIPYDDNNNPIGFARVPGFDLSRYIRSEGLSRAIYFMGIDFNMYTFEHDYYPKDGSPKKTAGKRRVDESVGNRDALLKVAAADRNPLTRAYAISKLAKHGLSVGEVIDLIQKQAGNLISLKPCYDILASSENSAAVNYLLQRMAEVDFNELILVRKALAESTNAEDVAWKNLEILASDSSTPFELAMSAYMLRHAYSKDNDQLNNAVDKELKRLAADDKTLREIRLAAVDSLQFSKNPNIFDGIGSKLSNSNDPGIKDVAAISISNHKKYDGEVEARVPEYDMKPDRIYIHSTYMFRRPLQLEWIRDAIKAEVKDRWKPGDKPIKVLIVGGSYGIEAVNIAATVLKDHYKNSAGWGRFNPKNDLKIITTDIDIPALVFARRAEFPKTGNRTVDANSVFKSHLERYGLDSKDFREFLHVGDDGLRLREDYRQMIEPQYLDIENADNYIAISGKAFLVSYCEVSQYLNEAEDRERAAKNVVMLSGRYMAVKPGKSLKGNKKEDLETFKPIIESCNCDLSHKDHGINFMFDKELRKGQRRK